MSRNNSQGGVQRRQAIITVSNIPRSSKQTYKQQESRIYTNKRHLELVKSSEKGNWMFRSDTKKVMQPKKQEVLTETKFRSLVMKNNCFSINNQNDKINDSSLSTLDKSYIDRQYGAHNMKRTGFGTLFDIDNRRFRIIKENSPSPHSYQKLTYNKTPKKRHIIPISHTKTKEHQTSGGPGPGAYDSEATFRKDDDRKMLKKMRLEKLQKYNELRSSSKPNKQNCLINADIQNKIEIHKQKNKESHGFSFSKSGKSESQQLLRTQLTNITKQYLQQSYPTSNYNDRGPQKCGDLHSRMFSNAFLKKNDHAYQLYLDPKVLRQEKDESEYIFIPGKKQPTVNRNSSPFLSKTIRNVF